MGCARLLDTGFRTGPLTGLEPVFCVPLIFCPHLPWKEIAPRSLLSPAHGRSAGPPPSPCPQPWCPLCWREGGFAWEGGSPALPVAVRLPEAGRVLWVPGPSPDGPVVKGPTVCPLSRAGCPSALCMLGGSLCRALLGTAGCWPVSLPSSAIEASSTRHSAGTQNLSRCHPCPWALFPSLQLPQSWIREAPSWAWHSP